MRTSGLCEWHRWELNRRKDRRQTDGFLVEGAKGLLFEYLEYELWLDSAVGYRHKGKRSFASIGIIIRISMYVYIMCIIYIRLFMGGSHTHII